MSSRRQSKLTTDEKSYRQHRREINKQARDKKKLDLAVIRARTSAELKAMRARENGLESDDVGGESEGSSDEELSRTVDESIILNELEHGEWVSYERLKSLLPTVLKIGELIHEMREAGKIRVKYNKSEDKLVQLA